MRQVTEKQLTTNERDSPMPAEYGRRHRSSRVYRGTGNAFVAVDCPGACGPMLESLTRLQ